MNTFGTRVCGVGPGPVWGPVPFSLLLLFDIDATLLSTSGSGMNALHDAAREEFGSGFSIEGVSFAGRLDPLIIGDMLRINGVADTMEHRARIRARYGPLLRERLKRPGAAAALPGVHDLLAALTPVAQRGEVMLGLLTGNFPETGAMKLRACGIDPGLFPVASWGDDAPMSEDRPPRREDLVPVGMSRAAKHRDPAPREFTIIGDTPHDVRCAHAHGGRCLAVATGKFTVQDLAEAGAHRVVGDLTGRRRS